MTSPSVFFRLFSFSVRFRLGAAALGFLAMAGQMLAAVWTVAKAPNEGGPGESIVVKLDDKIVARLIYGQGQQKPFVAIYDDQGRALTGSGTDKAGQATGNEPDERGIFIGWKAIESDLGKLDAAAPETAYKGNHADTWSMANGSAQQVVEIERMATNDDSATIVARIEWQAGAKDSTGSNVLLTETRRIRVTQPPNSLVQVDVTSDLMPLRDLRLSGDAQHGGVHIRLDGGIAARAAEASYLWSPTNAEPSPATGTVKSDIMKWGEFLFPLHGRWYTVAAMNSIANPVEEFAMRDYGRFGFFFKGGLNKDEPLRVSYRFLARVSDAPAEAPKRSADQLRRARRALDDAYLVFVHEVR